MHRTDYRCERFFLHRHCSLLRQNVAHFDIFLFILEQQQRGHQGYPENSAAQIRFARGSMCDAIILGVFA